MPRLGLAIGSALAALALAWLLVFPSGPAPAPLPDVLLVTIDTMRPDAVGPGKDTPALDAFLASATLFRNARTVVPLTLPALVSLFSGLLPAVHGVHDNASVLHPTRRDFTMLAEELRGAGYATAAFTPVSVTGPHASIHAGFELYDAQFGGASGLPYMPAERRIAAPIEWMRARDRKRPWFCWVHLFDPHDPYTPFPGDVRRPGTRAGDSPAALYHGEVRRVDAAVERLLEAAGPAPIVVIASDHGEGLGEHGEPKHGWLCYGATADVFLAVRAPALAKGAVDEGPRSLCDVAPTLRAWCGLPPKPSHGVPLFGPPRPVVVTESIHLWRAHGFGQCFAAFDGRFSLVESGPRVELFDRARDRSEKEPLDPAGHEAYERLDRAIDELRRLGAKGPEAEFAPSVATPYGSATRPVSNLLPRDENARLADPASRIAFLETLEALVARSQAAARARRPGALLALVPEWERLVAEETTSPAPAYHLAELQRALAVATGAREWHRRSAAAAREAVRRGYLASSAVELLCAESRASGDVDACREALELATHPRVLPDMAALEQIVELARFLRFSGFADAAERGTEALERARDLHAAPEDRARIEGWTRSLAAP